MATNPVTYRISPEVDAELKALADKHGGVDKALRVLLEAYQDLAEEFNDFSVRRVEMRERIERGARAFRGPLLKPKDRK